MSLLSNLGEQSWNVILNSFLKISETKKKYFNFQLTKEECWLLEVQFGGLVLRLVDTMNLPILVADRPTVHQVIPFSG
jgi:hypothetical protein